MHKLVKHVHSGGRGVGAQCQLLRIECPMGFENVMTSCCSSINKLRPKGIGLCATLPKGLNVFWFQVYCHVESYLFTSPLLYPHFPPTLHGIQYQAPTTFMNTILQNVTPQPQINLFKEKK